MLAAAEDLPSAAFVPGSVIEGLRPVYLDNADRDRGIEAHAHDSAADLAAALASANAELQRRLQDLPAGRTESEVERTPGATSVPLGLLPFQRLREVVVHHVDLLGGFTFADLDEETSQLLLAETVGRIAGAEPGLAPKVIRTDGEDGVVAIGGITVQGSQAQLLSWLLRQWPEGLQADGELPVVPAV